MIRTIIAASAVVAATALSPAAPAAAGAAQQAKRTELTLSYRTELTLSYTAEAGYAAAVKLRCHPDGGAHPTPAQACHTLANVAGRPDRLRPRRMMCMLIYAPVTARIAGTWKGKRIDWSKSYGNSCEMTRATGVLFRF